MKFYKRYKEIYSNIWNQIKNKIQEILGVDSYNKIICSQLINKYRKLKTYLDDKCDPGYSIIKKDDTCEVNNCTEKKNPYPIFKIDLENKLCKISNKINYKKTYAETNDCLKNFKLDADKIISTYNDNIKFSLIKGIKDHVNKITDDCTNQCNYTNKSYCGLKDKISENVLNQKDYYCNNFKSKFTQTDVVCDNNCQGSFTDWENCSKTCGTGQQTRTYQITSNAQNNGTTCPFNNGYQETRECNKQACQRDCNLSEWDKTTSNCSNKCGLPESTLVASRNIKTHPIGKKCESLTKKITCEATDPCPINCTGYWSNWTKCDKKCGKGEQTRTYEIPSNSQASNGGTTCPFNKGYQETRCCNTQDCPVDCVGSWSEWSECSGNCGEGIKTRTYQITKDATNGGKIVLSKMDLKKRKMLP